MEFHKIVFTVFRIIGAGADPMFYKRKRSSERPYNVIFQLFNIQKKAKEYPSILASKKNPDKVYIPRKMVLEKKVTRFDSIPDCLNNIFYTEAERNKPKDPVCISLALPLSGSFHDQHL